MRAAQAVDLAAVGRAHGGQQHAVAQAGSAGSSDSRKKGPREVPPRISMQGTGVRSELRWSVMA
jgi:hypothetical protein